MPDIERLPRNARRLLGTYPTGCYRRSPTALRLSAVSATVAMTAIVHLLNNLFKAVLVGRHADIGVAVDTERGLLVPVIRDVERKNIIEISVELQQIAQKARDRQLTLARHGARARIAGFLLDLSRKGLEGKIELPMSRGDIADYLGLTIETVSRQFTEFKTAGIIAADRGSRAVMVLDLATLQSIAED